MKKILIFVLCGLILLSGCSGAEKTSSFPGQPDADWHADWIWDHSQTSNSWMNFRKKIDLGKTPETAVARIAADSRYWLYINGSTVVFDGGLKRGPTPNDSYFDKVDIAQYLKPGENTIAVLVWYWGRRNPEMKSFSNIDSGKGGLLFELEADGNQIISNSTWKVKKNPAYLNYTPVYNDVFPAPNQRLPESNISYDARREITGWEKPEFDDSGWENATELGKAPCAPWNALYERPIPMWKDHGVKEYKNMDEYRNYINSDPDIDCDYLEMKLPYNAQITPYLKIKAPAGKKIEMKANTFQDYSGYSVFSKYVTKEGEQEFEALGWFNGDSVFYEIPRGVQVLSLGYRETGYDTELSGSFTANDDFYTTLWNKAQRTVYVSMRDDLLAEPSRERAVYMGDFTNEMLILLYALDTKAYLAYEKGVDTLIHFVDPKTKVMQTVFPAADIYNEIPIQQLAGICGFWQYYQYTGRSEVIERVYQAVREYLQLWQMGPDGLVVHRKSKSSFTYGQYGEVDWVDWGGDVDVKTQENAWYYQALTVLKEMTVLLDKQDDFQILEERMTSLKNGFAKLWNGKAYQSDEVKTPDDRANAIAILAGLADPDQYPAIRSVLTRVENASTYLEKYVLDALCEMGYMEDAQNRMRKRYSPMVEGDTSTLWEFWDNFNGSKNHGWSGGPLITMSKYMAGVAPLTPGYDTYRIRPDLGRLNEVSAKVPTVKGEITVDIKRDFKKQTVEMKVTSPENTVANVAVPWIDIGGHAGDNPAVNITVNGETVYHDGTPGELKGVTYQRSDDQYVYFDVQPGTWIFHLGAD